MKNTTTKKIAKYTALVAALTAGSEATSQIIYTDLDPDESFGYNEQYMLNLNADNGTNPDSNDTDIDFIIDATSNTSGFGLYNYLNLDPLGLDQGSFTSFNEFRLDNSNGQVAKLDASFSVENNPPGSYGSWLSFGGRLGLVYPGGSCASASFGGNFCEDTSSKYIGLRFFIGNATHYGWVRISTSDQFSTWTVEEYAYNAEAGAPIITGQIPDAFPTAICQDFTGNLDASGMLIINPLDIDNGSSDPEDGTDISIAVSPAVFNCDDIGDNPVTLTVTDSANQVTTCTATVTVVDNEAPVISNCPTDVLTESVLEGEMFTIPNYTAALGLTIDDNCEASITSQTPAEGTQISEGTTTIEIQGTDTAGNEVTCTFDLVVEETLGFEDTSLENNLVFYPNPTNGKLTLVKNNATTLLSAEVTDVNGKVIKIIDLSQNDTSTSISLEDVTSGLYFVKINSINASIVKKVIKE